MNDKVKNILLYTGIYGSIISAIAYLIVTYVLVMGFETAIDRDKQILFAILGAMVGLMISFLLKSQGITFAEQEEESQEVMKEYHRLTNKKKSVKKMRTIKWWMFWSTVREIFGKGLTIGLSTWLLLYIFMEGSGDFGLFLLALSNIFMFAGFGLIALSKAYDKYIKEHIPVIKELCIRLNDQQEQEKVFEEIYKFDELSLYPPVVGESFQEIPYDKLNDQVAVDSDRKSDEDANIQRRKIFEFTSKGSKEPRIN